MTVFADAYFYAAFINRYDEHPARVFAYARDSNDTVVTTEWVLTEVADALASSVSRSRLRNSFHALQEDEGTRIIGASSQHFARGLGLYDQRPDKAW